MAEQNRGFRQFIMDPKSSVMTYIADNIPPERLQQGPNGHGTSQGTSVTGQQPYGQDQASQSQSSFISPQGQTQGSEQLSQAFFAQPSAHSQTSVMNQPYLASNPNQQANTYPDAYNSSPNVNILNGSRPNSPPTQSISQSLFSHLTGHQDASYGNQGHASQPQHSMSLLDDASPSTLQGPPPAGTRRGNSAQSAPRLYHRMVQEHQTTKDAYYLSKSQLNTQGMTSAAYELEALSRRIWSLRVEHAWEFEGFSDLEHHTIVSGLHAQCDLWADTVLDFQDGQINGPSPFPNGNNSGDSAGEYMDSRTKQDSRQDKLGYQEVDGADTQSHAQYGSLQMPQMPQIQNLSMDSHAPMQQSLPSYQNSLPQQIASPQQAPVATNGRFSPPTAGTNMQQQQQQQHYMPPGQVMGQPPASGPTVSNRAGFQYPAAGTNGQQQQNRPPPQSMGQPPAAGLDMQQQPGGMPGQIIVQTPSMQQPLNRPLGQAIGAPSKAMQQQQNRPSGQATGQSPLAGPNTQQQQTRPPGQAMGLPPAGANMQQQQDRPPRQPTGQNQSQRPGPGSGSGPQMPPSLQAGPPAQGTGR